MHTPTMHDDEDTEFYVTTGFCFNYSYIVLPKHLSRHDIKIINSSVVN